MCSDAKDVAQYLAGLPEDRRSAVEAVREVILQHLPDGYEEAMNWGMIAYQVPLSLTRTRTTAGHSCMLRSLPKSTTWLCT